MSASTSELVEQHLGALIQSLSENTILKECISPADGYELSEEITLRKEEQWQLPHFLQYTIHPDSVQNARNDFNKATAHVRAFDLISSFKIASKSLAGLHHKFYAQMWTVSHISEKLLKMRRQIRSCQLEGNWHRVIRLLQAAEHNLLFPPPKNRPSKLFHGYKFPKSWYFWGFEASIYLGKSQAAESFMNEMAIKYELEPAERLWIQAQMAYADGHASGALALLQELLVHNQSSMTCLLIKRVVLVERLLNYLGQCDVSTDRGRRVFQTAAGKFSQLTDGCAYDEGVRSTMTKMFIFSSHKFNIRNCILPNLPQAPLVGPSRPRESSWMKRLTLQAPKILEMVLSPSKSALERSLAEMEALD